MITTFNADPNSALNADRSSGISESGAYVGVIKQAETYVTQGGAQMMRFWFTSREGGQETWLDLCVTKKDGTASWGMDLFNAMMVCMGVTTANATPGKARKRNGSINEDAMRIRSVEQKPIGLILQRENYTYTDQQTGEVKPTFRMNIMRAFHAETRKTASELIEGKGAQKVDAMLKTLKDKDRNPEQTTRPAAPAAPQSAPLDEDFPW